MNLILIMHKSKDPADSYLAALNYLNLLSDNDSILQIYNLGTESGYSVH